LSSELEKFMIRPCLYHAHRSNKIDAGSRTFGYIALYGWGDFLYYSDKSYGHTINGQHPYNYIEQDRGQTAMMIKKINYQKPM